MTPEEEVFKVLADLGLSSLQAKIYLYIVKNGSDGIEVRKISKGSKIARQDIYRILPTLEGAGLVEKIISTPTKYKPIPFEDGLRFLMERDMEKHQVIQKKAKSVLESIPYPLPDVEDKCSFVIEAELKLLVKRLKEKILNSSKIVDMIVGYKTLRLILFDTSDEFTQVLKRGVKIRTICKIDTEEPTDENLGKLMQSPSFELRLIKEEIPVALSIFDDKEAILCMGKTIIPSLWTNNQNIVKLSKIYYETTWAVSAQVLGNNDAGIYPHLGS